jgi:hypothetical protein
MTTEATVQAITDLLARENQALERTDYAAAIALVPEKEALFARLAAGAALTAAAGQRLLRLAAENQSLLARAIEVQTRVLGIVARAAAQAAGPGYAADGQHKRPALFGMALSARI